MRALILSVCLVVSISLHAGIILFASNYFTSETIGPFIKLRTDRIDVKIITADPQVHKYAHKINKIIPSGEKIERLNKTTKLLTRAKHLGELAIKYPRVSKILGEEGVVKLTVIVDNLGIVKEVIITKSSGFQRLDDYALKKIHASRFSPATKKNANGAIQATIDKIDLSIKFELI